MPARSTPFQKLVAHIQAQLSEGHDVVESAFLHHRLTGEEREVDVVVRARVGEHPLVVSVECIDHARPADSAWVEEMKAKHEHLETNRLVLVSRSGFYQPAVRLADKLGIVTYTPEEAYGSDWTNLVGKGPLFVARFDFTPIARWLRIETSMGSQMIEAGDQTELRRADGSPGGTLGQLVSALLNGERFATLAMDGLKSDVITEIQLDANVDDEMYALDTSGHLHRADALRVRIRAVRRTSQLDLTSMSWKGTPVAFGHDNTVLGHTTVTIVERIPGHVDAQVTVDGRTLGAHKRASSTDPTGGDADLS